MVLKMSEILEFIKEELNIVSNRIFELENNIRSYELDIEFIDKTCKKISKDRDNTNDVFLSLDNNRDFDILEIDKLKRQREEILSKIRNTNNELQSLNKRYEKLKRLKNLHNVAGELTINEADRKRIAIDIHDTIVQNLTAVLVKNDFILKIINSDVYRASTELKNNNDILKKSIDELREVIFNLSPMSIDDLGCEEAFSNLCQKMSLNSQMNIEYTCELCNKKIDKNYFINLLRIIQELINNSIKHSKGSKIVVNLKYKDDLFYIIQKDDGVGFNYEDLIRKTDNNRNFGLSIVKYRVNLYGGNIKFKNKKSGGIEYKIVLPYNNNTN